MGKSIDLTGKKIGRLLVIQRSGYAGSKHIKWLCECKCGKKVFVSGDSLRQHATQSCGCLCKEQVSKAKTKHGDAKKRLYTIWGLMKRRCDNINCKDYKDYGGRGIKICNEWREYLSFKQWALDNGYTNDLSIERKNVNGNYEPDNCCWATQKEQQNNKRNNKSITYNGKTQNMCQWAEELGFNYSTVYARMSRGISFEDSISVPLRYSKLLPIKINLYPNKEY